MIEQEESLEAGADAPAPEAVDASVEAAPVDTASDEASAPSEPSLSDDTGPDEAAPVSFPSADDFEWDSWDGGHETLPEQMRSWGERFSSHYGTRHQAAMEAQKRQIEDQHNLYEALIAGREDPRVAQYADQIKEWEEKHQSLETRYQSLESESQRFVESVNQSIEAEADRYAKAFQESNADVFNNDELSTKFADLLEEGWDLETAAEASRLPESALKIAKEAKADGVPDSYALKLARGTKMRTPQPRPGAKITSGATTPSRSPEQVETTDTGAMSLKDWRSHVARNALNKTKRRA
tara:strand:+ start:744 stop:1631 length:888 start_codon:yes stop_codon:yes gene_type:complete